MDTLDTLHAATVYATLKLERGIHQILVETHYQYKTALCTYMGQLELALMPPGLRGAPGTFQAVGDDMFFPVTGILVIPDIDNLLVYSPDLEGRATLMQSVLTTLTQRKGPRNFLNAILG